MKYNILGYLINEGFSNTMKNKKSTFAALGIMICTMIVFGVFFAISENIDKMLEELELSQAIQVFIELEATDEEVASIGQRIQDLDGVNTATFVTQEDAVDQMKEVFENNPDALDGLEGIFSVSYIVTFTDLEKHEAVQNEILGWEYVKKITNQNETTNMLMATGNSIRIVSIIILLFLVAVSLFIISNTIKLTVHARRKEISIMKYVGATNAFIRAPFIVEGVIIGLIAAMISLITVGGIYNWVAEQVINSAVTQRLGLVLVGFSDMLILLILVYAALGIGMGVLGSMISMKRYLEV